MKVNVMVLWLTVAMLGCISCKNENNETVVIPKVKVCKVESVSAGSFMQYPGLVKTKRDINLSFKVPGTIERVYPSKGEYVEKGQLVALLDSSDYRIQLDATQAEYEQIKAQAGRVIALYKESVTTPDDYDKARYGLQQITAKLENHKNQLGYTRIYAPFSGYVQELYFDEHEAVGAGMPIMSVVDENSLEVEINLPVSDVVDKENLHDAYCRFDVYPEEKFPLSIASINKKANSNQLYSMRLGFKDEKLRGRIYPGMVNMVVLEKKSDNGAVLSVPSGAIFHEDGKSYVMAFDEGTSTVHKKQVVVISLNKLGYSHIGCAGLEPGTCVVSSGVRGVKDGDKVQLLPEAAKSNIGGLL